MINLNNQKVLRILMPLIVLVIVLLFIFMLLPTRSKILSLKEEISIQRLGLEEKYQNGQLMKKIQSQITAIKPDLSKVEGSLLKEGQELFLITTLEEVARKNNLQQTISLDELVASEDSKKASGVVTLPTSVDLSGKFSDFIKYLADIENLGFYANWQKVSLRSGRPISGRGILPNLAPAGGTNVTDDDLLFINLEGETYWDI